VVPERPSGAEASWVLAAATSRSHGEPDTLLRDHQRSVTAGTSVREFKVIASFWQTLWHTPHPEQKAWSQKTLRLAVLWVKVPNWQTRMQDPQPVHSSKLTAATYSARNMALTWCLTVALVARHSARSHLQMPPMKGVTRIQTLWERPCFSCSAKA